MTTVVTEERIAHGTPDDAIGRLVVIPRGRRRGSWRALDADLVVATLAALDAGALVAARPSDADPGAAPLAAIATIMGLAVVRLPADEAAAIATVAVASRPGFAASDPRRALEVIAVLAADGVALPALRPAVLARWAARAWRPCGDCLRGGPGGRRCGCCGASLDGGPA